MRHPLVPARGVRTAWQSASRAKRVATVGPPLARRRSPVAWVCVAEHVRGDRSQAPSPARLVALLSEPFETIEDLNQRAAVVVGALPRMRLVAGGRRAVGGDRLEPLAVRPVRLHGVDP